MKKLTIALIVFALMFAGTANAQGMGEASMSEDVEQRIQNLNEGAENSMGQQMAQIGQKVREMRQEAREDGQVFGQKVREIVQERTQQLREERQEQMDQARERFQERVQELPEQAQRFAGLPKGLDKMKEQVTARYVAFLEDVEEIIAELDSEELTEEEEEELNSIKEEATALWEEVPEKSAKSYYEEYEDGEEMSFIGDMVQAFREDHVGFMQDVLSLRREVKTLYEEVTGEKFEIDEDEKEEE